MRNTIKKHSDFKMGDNGPSVKTQIFILKARKTIFPDDARYGLVVTKKTFKLAVTRNRVKRILRVWIRKNDALLMPDMDYIFIARRDILGTSATQGVETMKKALEEIGQKNEN